MSSASLGVLLRSIVTLEQQGAGVFFGEPEFDVGDLLADDARRRGHDQHPGALGRDGQAAPVQHVHALAARPAVPRPARGRRPAEAEAGLLLRRGPSPLRRRIRRAHGAGRADRPPHPFEGRRRLLRDAGPDGHPAERPRPARQPASSTPSGRSRHRTPTTCARSSGRSRSRRSTTSSRRSSRSGSARRWSRC